MKRELLSPLALSIGTVLGVTVALAACSSDGPQASTPTTSSSPDTTAGTPTTEPTATPTTDPDTPSTTDRQPQPQGFAAGHLSFFGDCAALLGYMQTEASERVTAWGLGGGGFVPMGGDVMMAAEDAAAPADVGRSVEATVAPAPVGAPADNFSETNTQEIGVDEGDIVETDGEYVYVANSDGLRIVRVADATVLAEPELPEGTHQLLLDGDRLLVVTSSWTGSADTIVSLYDVSDPANATLLRRSHLEGAVLATRSVDDVARLVISTSFDTRLPFVQPSQFGLDEELALERNQQIIAESAVEDWLPRWFDEAGDGTFGPMQPILDCNTVAAPDDFAGLGLTWIASVDLLGDATPVGSAGVVSTGDIVYSSAENLYITTQNWDWQFRPMPVDVVGTDDSGDTGDVVDDGPPPTQIHQFDLGEGTAATYVASGSVPGRLLNQFAMSEYNGDLRVATTTEGWDFGEQSESAVSVLRPNGEDLETISSGRWTRQDRADPIRAVPRRHGVRRDVPPDRSAVRDRSVRSGQPGARRRAEDPRLLGLPASGRRRPAARCRPERHRRGPHARHAAQPVRRERSDEPAADRHPADRRVERGRVGPQGVPVLAGRRHDRACPCRPVGTAANRSSCAWPTRSRARPAGQSWPSSTAVSCRPGA